ncbi:hypothetical protein ZIOFF_017406 [Zingiber officinale]|uniref:STAR protein homodimerisation region domain-containing protein n=1 Tax=Zingiber officinale TaxID=94328 RepID=A0A8J5H4I1_ZINOF|nr:hypothetical protein ZIOFF_017406 [Zingiber officinale]
MTGSIPVRLLKNSGVDHQSPRRRLTTCAAAKKAMDERIPPPGYFHYSPSGVHSSPSPHHPMRPSAATSDRERYLAELLAERQKLGPFLQVLPFCYRLLNQGMLSCVSRLAVITSSCRISLMDSEMFFSYTQILRASAFVSNPSFTDHERIEHASPLRLTGHPLNGGPMDLEGRSGMYTEENEYLHRMGVLRASSPGWGGTPGLAKSLVKKVVRLDVPVDKYPSLHETTRLEMVTGWKELCCADAVLLELSRQESEEGKDAKYES